MKKVAKKGWCITAAVMAVSVIVCIFCFVRWERKSSDLSFQFEETTYTYNVEVYAPTNYLWSTPNGNYFVAGMNNRETFKLFSPRGN